MVPVVTKELEWVMEILQASQPLFFFFFPEYLGWTLVLFSLFSKEQCGTFFVLSGEMKFMSLLW